MNLGIKYCLFASPDWVKQSYGLNPELQRPLQHYSLPDLMHSGLTNWAKVFDGIMDVPQSLDELRALDIVHINVPASGVGNLINLRRQVNRLPEAERPVIVANVDYAVEMWEGFREFDLFIQAIEAADVVFNVHPVMTASLAAVTNQKNLYSFPHPTDVDALLLHKANCQNIVISDMKVITIVAHTYDQNYLIPLYSVCEFLKRNGIRDQYQLVLVGGVSKDKMRISSMADYFYDSMQFPELMKLLMVSSVVIDTATTHSYGRVPVECAILGVPCIADKKVGVDNLHLSVDIQNGENIQEKMDTVVIKGIYEAEEVNPVLCAYGYIAAAYNMLNACYESTGQQRFKDALEVLNAKA